ncbi:unnamed protein product [Sphagnum balticum]
MNSETLMLNVAAALENTHLNGDLDVDIGNPSLCDPIMAGQMDALVSNSDTDADDDCEGGLQLVEPIDDEPEFAPEKKEDRYK